MNLSRLLRTLDRRLLATLLIASLSATAVARDAATDLGLAPLPRQVTPGTQKPTAPAAGMKAGTVSAAQAAGDWLLTQQNASGGFPWTPGDTVPQYNVQGAIALGLLRAYERTHDVDHLNGAKRNGDCQTTPGCIVDGE